MTQSNPAADVPPQILEAIEGLIRTIEARTKSCDSDTASIAYFAKESLISLIQAALTAAQAEVAKRDEVIEKLAIGLESPDEETCALARGFLLGLSGGGGNDFDTMRAHLDMCGYPVPEWMNRKGHITKWDRAECIWKLMAEPLIAVAAPFRKAPAAGEE